MVEDGSKSNLFILVQLVQFNRRNSRRAPQWVHLSDRHTGLDTDEPGLL